MFCTNMLHKCSVPEEPYRKRATHELQNVYSHLDIDACREVDIMDDSPL